MPEESGDSSPQDAQKTASIREARPPERTNSLAEDLRLLQSLKSVRDSEYAPDPDHPDPLLTQSEITSQLEKLSRQDLSRMSPESLLSHIRAQKKLRYQTQAWISEYRKSQSQVFSTLTSPEGLTEQELGEKYAAAARDSADRQHWEDELNALGRKQQDFQEDFASAIKPITDLNTLSADQIEEFRHLKAKSVLQTHLTSLNSRLDRLSSHPELAAQLATAYRQQEITALIDQAESFNCSDEEKQVLHRLSSEEDGEYDRFELRGTHTIQKILRQIQAATPENIQALIRSLQQDAQKNLASLVIDAAGIDIYTPTGREVLTPLGKGLGSINESNITRTPINNRYATGEIMQITGFILDSPQFQDIIGSDSVSLSRDQIATHLSNSGLRYPKENYLDHLQFFPSPKAVSTLILVSACQDNNASFKCNTALDQFITRPDWPQLVDETIKAYPELAEIKDYLLPPKSGRRTRLADKIDTFAYSLLNSESDHVEKTIVRQALSTPALLREISHYRDIEIPTDTDNMPFLIRSHLRTEALDLLSHHGSADKFNRLSRLVNLTARLPPDQTEIFKSDELITKVASGTLTPEQIQLALENCSSKAWFSDSLFMDFVFLHFSDRFLTPSGITDLISVMDSYPASPHLGTQMIRLIGEESLTVARAQEISSLQSTLPPGILAVSVSFPELYLTPPGGIRHLQDFVAAFGNKPQFLNLFSYDITDKQASFDTLEVIHNKAPVTSLKASENTLLAITRSMDKIDPDTDLPFADRIYQTLDGDADIAFRIYSRSLDSEHPLRGSQDQYLQYLQNLRSTHPDILRNEVIFSVLSSNMHHILELTPEKQEEYLGLFIRIDNSPVQEIQRVKAQLIEALLDTDNPLDSFSRVEQVFTENRVNMTIRYQVFDILHPRNILDSKVNAPHASPRLKELPPEDRKGYIFTGLFQVQLESSNPSLIKLLTTLRDRPDSLDPGTIADADLLLTASPDKNPSVPPGESLIDTFTRRILVPAGFNSPGDAVAYAEKSKKSAEARSNSFTVNSQNPENFHLHQGDLLKAVDSTFLNVLLQDGILPKEMLGASAGSDLTPLDTDFAKITASVIGKDNSETFRSSIAARGNYGDIFIVVRDRDQFNHPGAQELFQSGVINEEHYGITVGCPSTEIDYIITPHANPGIYFDIAKNGRYIPVVDVQGNLLFSRAEYDNLRKSFAGIPEYGGESITIHRTTPDQPHAAQIAEIISELDVSLQSTRDKVALVSTGINTAMNELDIHPREKSQARLLDAELIDIGSTGRQTNIPGEDLDYDFSLVINAADFARKDQIVARLKDQFPAQEFFLDTTHPDYQVIRLTKASLPDGGQADIDIGLGKKSRLRVLESHDGITEKLASIATDHGEQAEKEVIANIILAKKLLKEHHVYKKAEGGFGGIGVENWIIQNGGNLINALLTFRNTAYQEGKLIDFRSFQERYHIYDAGINLRDNRYDDFSKTLSESGYRSLAKVADTILSGYGYESISP